MIIKANNVSCEWLTEGKEYEVEKAHEELGIFEDDQGQESIIHLGAYFHLNEYVEWEVLRE